MTESVTVGVRIRPLNKRELSGKNSGVAWGSSGSNVVTRVDVDASTTRKASHDFHYDAVFDKTSTNDDVFTTLGVPVVEAALGGFNGTIFAYGQTSSGKTHSMVGSPDDPGMTPRAIQYVLDAAAKSRTRNFLIRAVYVEIYNEKIRDLLNPASADLNVREDKAGRTFVDAQETLVETLKDAMAVLDKGQAARAVGETKMNAGSSRSHTVFTLLIESKAVEGLDASFRASSLNLVDLAGSERLNSTGAAGKRQTEGCHINKSLLVLGTIINRISAAGGDLNKAGHIPYRDSKLTRLLRPALGGNARTAVLCAITPAAAHAEETLSTLKFAERAKKVSNNALRNEVIDYRAKYKEASEEMEVLREQFSRMEKEIAALRSATYPGGLPSPPVIPTRIVIESPHRGDPTKILRAPVDDSTSVSSSELRSASCFSSASVTASSRSESEVTSSRVSCSQDDSSPVSPKVDVKVEVKRPAEEKHPSTEMEAPSTISSVTNARSSQELQGDEEKNDKPAREVVAVQNSEEQAVAVGPHVSSERLETEAETSRAIALRAARDEVKYLKAQMDEVETENEDLKSRLKAKAKEFTRLHSRALELRTAARQARSNERRLRLAVKAGYEKLEEARRQLEQSRKKGAHVKLAETVLEELSGHMKQLSSEGMGRDMILGSSEAVAEEGSPGVTATGGNAVTEYNGIDQERRSNGSSDSSGDANGASLRRHGLGAATELALRLNGAAAAQFALRGGGAAAAAAHMMVRPIRGDGAGGIDGMRWATWGAMMDGRGGKRRPRPLPDDMVADIDDSESEPGSPAAMAHLRRAESSVDDIVERRDSLIDGSPDELPAVEPRHTEDSIVQTEDDDSELSEDNKGGIGGDSKLNVNRKGEQDEGEGVNKRKKSLWRSLRSFYGYTDAVYDQMMAGHKIERRTSSVERR